MEKTKLLIIGSGPAGYTAAIYAGRANLSPVLVEGMQPGGQLTTTTEVENFPGFPEGIDANELMDNMRAQAERFGCKFILSTVERTDFSASPYRLWLDDGSEIEADSVIIATGASAKYLGLSDEQKYMGMGVSACATCVSRIAFIVLPPIAKIHDELEAPLFLFSWQHDVPPSPMETQQFYSILQERKARQLPLPLLQATRSQSTHT